MEYSRGASASKPELVTPRKEAGEPRHQHHKRDEIADPQQNGSADHASREKLRHWHASGPLVIDDELTAGCNIDSRAHPHDQIPNVPPRRPAHYQKLDRIGQCADQHYRQTERQNAADIEQRLPINHVDQPGREQSNHHPRRAETRSTAAQSPPAGLIAVCIPRPD